jgi:hypothetical protein
MDTTKISLASLQNPMSRSEMRQIKGGDNTQLQPDAGCIQCRWIKDGTATACNYQIANCDGRWFDGQRSCIC